jgi:twitching motility protein PilJ
MAKNKSKHSVSQTPAVKEKALNRTYLLYAMAAVALLISALTFWQVYRSTKIESEYLRQVSGLRLSSQSLAKHAVEATAGSASAFSLMEQEKSEYASIWQRIISGDDNLGLSASSVYVKTNMKEITLLQSAWSRVHGNIDIILDGQNTVLELNELAVMLRKSIPRLQEDSHLVAQELLAQGAPAAVVALAERQSLLAERIARNIDRILEGDEQAVLKTDSFGKDTLRFGTVLSALRDGNAEMGISKIRDPDLEESIDRMSLIFVSVNDGVKKFLSAADALFKVKLAARKILTESGDLLNYSTQLSVNLAQMKTSNYKVFSAIFFFVLSLSILIFIFWTSKKEKELQAAMEKERNDRNQNAIMRLLDEIGDLANGDLTVETTVTEDITGAIADSINYAIDQMRQLVSSINQTAFKISTSTRETQSAALKLANASNRQAQEIRRTATTVTEMVHSIDQVSLNAQESALVAERSVAFAKKGGDVVNGTIEGMNKIRDQIQETSKRIKRLGESSQEIGDIVSLINDIADQTNILALNAAIQASMAGDAGRGFAVVADEVQRLAERASKATNQIEALVKTIQNDTNEAVISMEHTTIEVVSGARLTQDAGIALDEIKNVSGSLAELIRTILAVAKKQTDSASQIAAAMKIIEEITTQTATGSQSTAQSIGDLTELSDAMKQSVAGFKLPQPRKGIV